jgi:hypothetical protein
MTNEYGGIVFFKNVNPVIVIYSFRFTGDYSLYGQKNLVAGIMVHIKKVFSEDYSVFMGSRL